MEFPITSALSHALWCRSAEPPGGARRREGSFGSTRLHELLLQTEEVAKQAAAGLLPRVHARPRHESHAPTVSHSHRVPMKHVKHVCIVLSGEAWCHPTLGCGTVPFYRAYEFQVRPQHAAPSTKLRYHAQERAEGDSDLSCKLLFRMQL